MTYTIVVEKVKKVSGKPDGFFTFRQPVAWLPGFESPAQALDHATSAKMRAVYPDHAFVILEGDQFGPLRSKYEHLIWYRPLPFVFDPDIAMKMADLGNGPAPTVTGHWE